MSQCRGRSHSRRGVPLQAASDKVEEERVVAALERGLELAGAGRAARLSAPAAAVQHGRPVRQGRGCAVPGVT